MIKTNKYKIKKAIYDKKYINNNYNNSISLDIHQYDTSVISYFSVKKNKILEEMRNQLLLYNKIILDYDIVVRLVKLYNESNIDSLKYLYMIIYYIYYTNNRECYDIIKNYLHSKKRLDTLVLDRLLFCKSLYLQRIYKLIYRNTIK